MPSNTPNLQLYKKDPATDGNDYFDVSLMLNDNWDKTDTFKGNFDTHLAETVSNGVHGMGSIASQDYEEGTFTATLLSGGGSGSTAGYYRRIGSSVTVVIFNKGDQMSGLCGEIGGLPFAAAHISSGTLARSTYSADDSTANQTFIVSGTSIHIADNSITSGDPLSGTIDLGTTHTVRVSFTATYLI